MRLRRAAPALILAVVALAIITKGSTCRQRPASRGADTFAEANVQRLGRALSVRAGDDLQSAINSAQPGDVLSLEAGAVFTGNFTLPQKQGTDFIEIRSSAPDADLPPADSRIDPSYKGSMAGLISPNSDPVISTAASAHHYKFTGIEFGIAPSVTINYGIVVLGSSSQQTLDVVPHDLILDRCYVHGNPTADVQRGIVLNSAATSVINSYVSDCHGIGFDTQAILGWNGPGPFKIVNNYLEASGENVMFGGADPAIPNLVPSDIEFRQNHCAKQVSWKDGILQKPASPVLSAALSVTGALSSGATYYYRIAAVGTAGYNVAATSLASDEASIMLAPGQNSVSVSVPSINFASGYQVFRTADPPGSQTRAWAAYQSPTPAFVDTGDTSSASTGVAPPTAATHWTVKNLLELKNARRVLIDGNLFEYSWVDAQTGFAVLFKSVNQEGKAPWSVTEDVTFTNNVVRHAAGGASLLGRENTNTFNYTSGLTLSNNLFYDIGAAVWGGVGRLFEIASGPAVNGSMIGPANLTISHNTCLQTQHIILASEYDANNGGFGTKPGFVFTYNIVLHNDYGVFGDNGGGIGNPVLVNYFPDCLFNKNVIVGGQDSRYPPKNYFPATVDTVGFLDRGADNYRLSGSSQFKGLAKKGADIGADVDKIGASMSASDPQP